MFNATGLDYKRHREYRGDENFHDALPGSPHRLQNRDIASFLHDHHDQGADDVKRRYQHDEHQNDEHGHLFDA